MDNQAIFDRLKIGQYCKFKNKLSEIGVLGFIEGKKYPIIEIQNNCQMVSFKDPIDGAITDFYGKNFLTQWDYE